MGYEGQREKLYDCGRHDEMEGVLGRLKYGVYGVCAIKGSIKEAGKYSSHMELKKHERGMHMGFRAGQVSLFFFVSFFSLSFPILPSRPFYCLRHVTFYLWSPLMFYFSLADTILPASLSVH